MGKKQADEDLVVLLPLTRRSPSPVPCTWEVPASAGRASSPPLALIERCTPLLHLTRLERVCRQVTDLQPSELTQEITERHPERERDPVTP